MVKCSGFDFGKKPTKCPVRETCQHYFGAKEGDTLKSPKTEIKIDGCQAYARITLEQFKAGAK